MLLACSVSSVLWFCNPYLMILLVDEKKGERRKKKKKRVHFADDVIKAVAENEKLTSEGNLTRELKSKKCQVRKMPANRMALYKGILRDRPQRMV